MAIPHTGGEIHLPQGATQGCWDYAPGEGTAHQVITVWRVPMCEVGTKRPCSRLYSTPPPWPAKSRDSCWPRL